MGSTFSLTARDARAGDCDTLAVKTSHTREAWLLAGDPAPINPGDDGRQNSGPSISSSLEGGTFKASATGRREVGDFYGPGGVCGLEPSAERCFAAEGVTDCEFLVVLRYEIRADPQLQHAIDAAMRLELARAQDHLSLLRRTGAREKVASFLTRLSGPHAASPVALPMGRQDVADFLGLTMETVSRVLSQFERDGVLRFAGPRQFEVQRPQVLAALAA